MSENDSGNASRCRISRPFAQTLHDFSLRPVQRAGRYLVENEQGFAVTYTSGQILDRYRRRCEQHYDVMHDIFEQKVLWMRRVLILTFDVAGEWEFRLLLPQGGSVIIALGSIERGEFETMGQDVPAFQVPNLIPLIQRTERQIRLRNEYRHHLS